MKLVTVGNLPTIPNPRYARLGPAIRESLFNAGGAEWKYDGASPAIVENTRQGPNGWSLTVIMDGRGDNDHQRTGHTG
jgi:hypothetical protein